MNFNRATTAVHLVLGKAGNRTIKPQRSSPLSVSGSLVRCLSLIGLVIVGFPLVGCRPSDREGAVELRLGHVYEVNSPTHRFGTSQLNDQLAKTNVDLRVNVYPAGQLGSEAELLEQLVAGEIDLAIAGPSFLAMWHPPLGAFDAAYVFTDLEHMQQVADGPLMAPHWAALREQFGVRVLATWAYGVRHITANRPLRHPDDLAGFRLRMPGARVWQESGAALGASPMPMSFSEVYMALQQGIADGQENPIPVIHSMGFHEVQKCLVLTGHIQSSIQVLINERSWQRLDDEQQQALLRSVQALGSQVVAGIEQQERELLAAWRKDGTMEIIEDVNVEAFRKRARDYFAEGFAFSELYDQIARAAEEPAEGEL